MKITVSPRKTSRFTVYLRIPGWAGNQPVPGDLYSFAKADKDSVFITVNGIPFNFESVKGYAVIDRQWMAGDVVNYSIPMTIHQIEANRKVIEDTGKVALERGPIVYCLEEIDNRNIEQVTINAGALLTARFDTTLLNGVETLSGHDSAGTENFTAIPYFAWNNRGACRMKVWIPTK